MVIASCFLHFPKKPNSHAALDALCGFWPIPVAVTACDELLSLYSFLRLWRVLGVGQHRPMSLLPWSCAI